LLFKSVTQFDDGACLHPAGSLYRSGYLTRPHHSYRAGRAAAGGCGGTGSALSLACGGHTAGTPGRGSDNGIHGADGFYFLRLVLGFAGRYFLYLFHFFFHLAFTLLLVVLGYCGYGLSMIGQGSLTLGCALQAGAFRAHAGFGAGSHGGLALGFSGLV
jgi:hypothetical protein